MSEYTFSQKNAVLFIAMTVKILEFEDFWN